MSTRRVFTRGEGITVRDDETQRRDYDWDRRMIVLEGEWESVEKAVAAYKDKPVSTTPSTWWPESVTARPTGGGLIRVTLECLGLFGNAEKWYNITEDNGELRSYQLSGVTILAPEYGWTPSAVYARANVEQGVPKLGWIGFGWTKPDQGKNGHPVAAPIRGTFPAVTPPPWRASGVTVTANFPGGWRQVAAPYRVIGGFNTTGLPLMTPPLIRGEWLYNYVDKRTL